MSKFISWEIVESFLKLIIHNPILLKTVLNQKRFTRERRISFAYSVIL